MSTYYGYVCKSHEPNLISEHWLNHGDQELTDAYHAERNGDWPSTLDGGPAPLINYAGAAPIYWLRQHPNCTIALHNEYGDETPLEADPCTEIANLSTQGRHRSLEHSKRS